MARAVVHSQVGRRAAFEPLYEIDPRSGASIEVFFGDRVLAASFRTHSGWFWWTCQPGYLPVVPPNGPFDTSYGAYRDATMRVCTSVVPFGKKLPQ